ncbi:hypothetical protein O6H91_04G031100 [Diphasiastrum complanatum]|uniref:Uncharacterized protein n=1 Tax=Diphasiastrum complanatum TaxID=34168 RepID=A0ACC2DVU6_DIPCM|nr:hypothetical protein O6H91_04G031100 [Diphasiastrum complanatum]
MLMMAAIKVHVDIIANTTFLSINPQELKPYHSYSPLLCWGHKAARLSISAEWSSSTTRRNDKLQIFVTKAEELQEDGGRFSVWDSNAENVRMSRSGRSMRRTYPLPPPSFTNPKQRPVNEWDYEAQDGRYARKGGYMGQWNLSGDDYNFDSEEGEKDAEEDQGDFWPSTLNLDIRAVVGFVGLVFPAMLMTVPWLFNNPLGLMVALAFLPAASKFLAPVVWAQKSLSQLLGYFNSKPKKKTQHCQIQTKW